MKQRITTAVILLALAASFGLAQDNPFPRFKQFKGVIPGVDVYATQRTDFESFVKPVADARAKMAGFIGDDIAPGAIFICSTLEQKDTVYEQRVFKYGYKWYLSQMTAEAQRQERMVRMQAAAATSGGQGDQGSRSGQSGRGGQTGQSRSGDTGAQSGRQGGGQDRGAAQPGGRQGPGGQTSAEMRGSQEARAATAIAGQVCYAILMSSLNNPKPYRQSRLDDMSRSPLNDWLDIALVAYATGQSQNVYRTLQDRPDDTFPLDDVLSMSRPFVAFQDTGVGGAGSMTVVVSGGGGGGRGQGGGGRGGSAGVMPKDVMDRMMFDAQASGFLNYLIEKAGLEKVKDMVRQNRNNTETLEVVMNLMGSDVDKIEREWSDWIKAQKPANPQTIIR